MNINALTDYGEDMSGIKQLADALKTNSTLQTLQYAQPKPQGIVLAASDALIRPLFCSLEFNALDATAAKHLAGALKVNKALTSLKYAATHRFPTVSCPLTPPFDSRWQLA